MEFNTKWSCNPKSFYNETDPYSMANTNQASRLKPFLAALPAGFLGFMMGDTYMSIKNTLDSVRANERMLNELRSKYDMINSELENRKRIEKP